ncbi:type II secretion system F family protein [Marinobacterium marinum]|uniref:Type II secretion system F family protein n=1 Tax=Marinobacterium marinum TaxID=2756129 RepID=A0A7W1WW85_9GAMM|nr:type II secretion system F family protein [Marinobacterium marinum]MBA4501308.1 type II secretion system F family protein [Marinobacterium marinum]
MVRVAAASKPSNKPQKKHTFNWQGKDKSGNSSKGKIDAESLAAAKTLLRKQGVRPSKVVKERASLFSAKDKPIKPADIAYFIRQLATMMKAGVPLLQAMDIVGNGTEKDKLKHMIYAIRDDVNGGSDLSRAFENHPEQFDDLVCSLINAGEQSGALETMLDRIATYKEKVESLKKKIKKALTYPTAVIVVGVIVSAILLVKVVPQFESVFKSFGADLPAFTQWVIGLSEWAQQYWFIGLLGAIGAGFAFTKARTKSQKFSDFVDRSVLRIPIIGPILHKAAIARFARTLATTFSAGVPLVEALDSAAGAAGNVVYHNAIIQIRNGVSTGQSLQNAINMTGVFPTMTVQMVAIGEEAGSLDMMLDKVATFYEEDVDNAVDNLSSLMEPLIMAVLGVLVGGLVIAMYLPIFQLGNVV